VQAASTHVFLLWRRRPTQSRLRWITILLGIHNSDLEQLSRGNFSAFTCWCFSSGFSFADRRWFGSWTDAFIFLEPTQVLCCWFEANSSLMHFSFVVATGAAWFVLTGAPNIIPNWAQWLWLSQSQNLSLTAFSYMTFSWCVFGGRVYTSGKDHDMISCCWWNAGLNVSVQTHSWYILALKSICLISW
jgi:hypothetical protein